MLWIYGSGFDYYGCPVHFWIAQISLEQSTVIEPEVECRISAALESMQEELEDHHQLSSLEIFQMEIIVKLSKTYFPLSNSHNC